MLKEPPFSTTALDEIYEGDKQLFREIMEILAAKLPQDLDELAQALEERNFDAIGGVAHRIKSSLVTAAAVRAAGAAESVEKSASTQDLKTSASQIERLGFEIDSILAYYRTNEWENLFR